MNVTDIAKNELKRILATRSLPPDKYLRLAIPPTWNGPGDFGIVIDVEGDGDEFIEVDGIRLLALDPVLVERLADAVFDFKESNGSDGAGFTLDVF